MYCIQLNSAFLQIKLLEDKISLKTVSSSTSIWKELDVCIKYHKLKWKKKLKLFLDLFIFLSSNISGKQKKWINPVHTYMCRIFFPSSLLLMYFHYSHAQYFIQCLQWSFHVLWCGFLCASFIFFFVCFCFNIFFCFSLNTKHMCDDGNETVSTRADNLRYFMF